MVSNSQVKQLVKSLQSKQPLNKTIFMTSTAQSVMNSHSKSLKVITLTHSKNYHILIKPQIHPMVLTGVKEETQLIYQHSMLLKMVRSFSTQTSTSLLPSCLTPCYGQKTRSMHILVLHLEETTSKPGCNSWASKMKMKAKKSFTTHQMITSTSSHYIHMTMMNTVLKVTSSPLIHLA